MRLFLDFIKHIIECHRNQAILLIPASVGPRAQTAEHGIGLTRACHAVDEYSGVKALKGISDGGDHSLLENFGIVHTVVENFLISVDFFNLVDGVVRGSNLHFVAIDYF